MSGYKRVNYYELCRLCATNQQKEKTHIFQEEGRKIQLLNKIQSCLSLTVYEHDFLPKVVCSKCLKSLESYYTFKQECVSSETMLSSYFKNFRYTEDFKKSGKVYIKDTAFKNTNDEEVIDVTTNQVVTSTQPVQVAAPSQSQQNAPLLQNYVAIAGSMNETSKSMHNQNQAQMEQVQSYYAVQLPQSAIVPNQSAVEPKPIKTESQSKIIQHSQVAYNFNSLNLASTNAKNQQKPQETINNVVVNANGEVINIGQLVDIESIINQASVPKIKNNNFKQKRIKEIKIHDDPIIKIDLTENEHKNEYDTNPDKLPHIKSTQNHQKYTYTTAAKIEEKVQVNMNPTVIFNTVPDYQVPISNFVPFHQNSGNINYSNASSNTVNIAPPSVCTSSSNEHSTVNLNALNGDSLVGGSFRNSSQFAAQTVKTAVREAVKNENVASSFKNSSNPEKLHICDICHKSFKRREHLFQHVKLHTGFRPYTCENCNKSFMRKEHLLRHMTSHSGQKNYTCNICEKSFSRNDNLLKHKKTHEKQNSFTCEVCQKQFVMKHYYLAHKVTHEVVERCMNQTLGILKA